MSSNWVHDINKMQTKYGVRKWISNASPFELKKYLEFRLDFIKEEYDETREAFVMEDAEEIVDGLIDLCVVAIGTLDAMGVNANRAWDGVLEANMAKEVGEKPERPNPLGLPDLIKPAGWVAPSHKDNHGIIPKSMEVDSNDFSRLPDEIDYNKVDFVSTERRWDFSPDEDEAEKAEDEIASSTGKLDFTKDSEYVKLTPKKRYIL